MANDVEDIVRVVSGFSRIPDKYGRLLIEVEYRLKPVDLEFLQKLFNIDPNDPDIVATNMIYDFKINVEQAKALQPYIIDGFIDLDKYDFHLSCYPKI